MEILDNDYTKKLFQDLVIELKAPKSESPAAPPVKKVVKVKNAQFAFQSPFITV